MNGYRLLIAGDVHHRDGLSVELEDDGGLTIAEVFRDDEAGRHTVRFFDDEPVGLDVVTWYLSAAREVLFPAADEG